MSDYIEKFEIKGLWKQYDLAWKNVRSDVNILVGINGAGKTTLVNAIYAHYAQPSKKNAAYSKAFGNDVQSKIFLIQSFDVPADAKKKANSPLLNNLLGVIMQNTERPSLTNYRLIPVNYPAETERVTRRVAEFFELVDSFFSETGKSIEIDKSNNMPVFRLKNDTVVQVHDLSAGEKQLLYILLTVFLMDEQPSVLLLDEPELSLHITWQERLISTLRKLNPHCQIIMSTHSPSIFLDGWRNHLVFMEDIVLKQRIQDTITEEFTAEG